MTYAIIATGGKQYRVTPGEILRVPALRAEVGETIELPVLALSDGEQVKIGHPTVEGARAVCRVLEHGKERKIIVFKFKRRKQYRRKKGHRQKYTAIRVEAIQAA
ncbi:MAG: 50S ribosomal protein L21 [Blastocatellia bacterium]|nr:50S ribosomal protein L21 [Blastocatellia bacterium]MCS7157334.1 50S ribosomal protein L21 [Blastocatellia bacterium]MCX7753200.1 50S ribosomal protein L21 [Blastocatellia bacterium]MDW8168238.1 50S ribosomal protein L21 [Acidobacteriota bacterium]MDW8255468.1 50S ribosomal protein L21 [Acidobacteriota bacterium]